MWTKWNYQILIKLGLSLPFNLFTVNPLIFTKEDHVSIVQGPGNSLDRDFNYKIEKDLDSISKNIIHNNVSFGGLLKHHDTPHMSKWVRRENLRLECVLWNANRSHIGLTDISSIDRFDQTINGFYLNSSGKEKLVKLILSEIRCKPDFGKIPVIIGLRSMPFSG